MSLQVYQKLPTTDLALAAQLVEHMSISCKTSRIIHEAGGFLSFSSSSPSSSEDDEDSWTYSESDDSTSTS
jgi:hypothetical protein